MCADRRRRVNELTGWPIDDNKRLLANGGTNGRQKILKAHKQQYVDYVTNGVSDEQTDVVRKGQINKLAHK